MLEDKLKNARILIIDDQADTVHLLEIILRQAGYVHVVGTTEPRAAVDLYTQFQPDLVLLDLMLPQVDGFAVMEQIRRLIPADSILPIVILTADVTPESKAKALRAGASDFLVKPFDGSEVVLRIANLLQTRFLHLDLQRQNSVQAQLFEEVQTSHNNLQLLSQRLFEAQEVERRHIARELHDEIGTALTAIKISMQAAQHVARHLADAPTIMSAPAISDHLSGGIDVLERLLRQVRELSLNLRPSMLDDFGLIDTLAWYVDRQAQWAGLTARCTHHDITGRLDPFIETACFRIAQEAITNVVRHAHAGKIEVELQRHEHELSLIIRDNGIGFDVERARQRALHGDSLGVLGMEERVQLLQGKIEINSAPGAGTEIRVSLPLAAADAAPGESDAAPASPLQKEGS